MFKSIALVALLLAVCYVATASEPSNATSTSVELIFRDNGRPNLYTLRAVINGSQKVKISIYRSFGNNTLPKLKLKNLGERHSIESRRYLYFKDRTDIMVKYTFRPHKVPRHNGPCAFGISNITCRVSVRVSSLNQNTDLFFTIDTPRHGTPSIKIVGSGFNQYTQDLETIDTLEDQFTLGLEHALNYTVSDDHETYYKEEIKLLTCNADIGYYYNTILALKPVFTAFQCNYTNGTNFIVNSLWTDGEGVYGNSPINLTDAQLPTDSSFTCNTMLLFTEKRNLHSLMSFRVGNSFFYNHSRRYENRTASSSFRRSLRSLMKKTIRILA